MTFFSVVCGVALALLYPNAAPAQGSVYAQATELVRGGKPEAAIPLLEELVRGAPDDLRARNLLGIALMGSGRREDASTHFAQALKLDPSFLPALKNLAHNELDLGAIQSAREHFKAALKLSADDPSVHLGMGHIAFLEGSHADASHHYEKSKGLQLQDPLGQVRYASSCVATGKRDDALRALSLFTQEGSPPIHFQAGVVFAELERYENAIHHFELALMAGLNAPEVAYNLALAHLKNGNAEAALLVARRALEQGAPTAELYSLVAQAHEKSGRTKDAYEALRNAIRISPREERSYVELVALCLDHENQQLGLEIADIGLKQIPRSSKLHLQRGVIHALDSRSDQALADFRAAVNLAPDAPLGYIAQALQLLRVDQNAESVEVLRARTKAAPGDALANWILAEALVKLGAQPEAEAEAVELLERSVRSNGKLPQSRVLLAKLMLARGDSGRAQIELEKALQLDPSSVSATYLLGQVYRKQGRTDDANRLFAKISDAKADGREQADNKVLLRIVRENLPKSNQ